MFLLKVLAFPSALAAWVYVSICNGLLSALPLKVVKGFMLFHVVAFALIVLVVGGGALGALFTGHVWAALGGMLHAFVVLSAASGSLYAYRLLDRK